MKNTLAIIVFSLLSLVLKAQNADRIKISIDEKSKGDITFLTRIRKDSTVKKGTIFKVKAASKSGKVLDALFLSYPGMWGTMYTESMTDTFSFKADKDINIGASYIDSSEVAHINVTQNIVYATPGVKPLKYDVFSPKGARNLPIIIIIHGGGWSSNTEDVMRGLARELTRSQKFVVFSLDYRWLGNLDGDKTPNKMHHLMEDIFGGIVHIKENAHKYGADGSRIFLTGDSAGGHLSATGSLMIEKLGYRGFGNKPGVFELMPSYMPKDTSIEQVRVSLLNSIKAAAPSYGAFRNVTMQDFVQDGPEYLNEVSPINDIPEISKRAIPQFLLRGTKDPIILNEEVSDFMDALIKKDQRVEYIQIGSASHAFFDWKPDDATKKTFTKYGIYYAQRMEAFFLDILNDK